MNFSRYYRYRGKFFYGFDPSIIEYDYDEAVEKCKKRQMKIERADDIGEDGLSHLIGKGIRAEKEKEKQETATKG